MSQLLRGLSGYVCTRNCVELDYPLIPAILSLLPVCDEVVVCDNLSEDETPYLLRDLADAIPQIRLIEWDEPLPIGDRTWYDRWLNFTREHLRYDMQLSIDADEVIGPESYPSILSATAQQKAFWFQYVNFHDSPQRTVPWGDSRKAQIGPTKYWIASHAPVPDKETDLRQVAEVALGSMNLYHYNSLRREQAFVAKQRLTMKTLEGCDDLPLEEAIRNHRRYVSEVDPLTIAPFGGSHPPVIRQWLRERGWTV